MVEEIELAYARAIRPYSDAVDNARTEQERIDAQHIYTRVMDKEWAIAQEKIKKLDLETVKNRLTGETGEVLGRTQDGVTVRVNNHTTWWKNSDIEERVDIKCSGKLFWSYQEGRFTYYWEAEGYHEHDYLIELDKSSGKYKLDVLRKSDKGVFESFDVSDEEEGYEKAEEWEEEWAPENDKNKGDTKFRVGDRVDYTNPEGARIGEGMIYDVKTVSGGGYRYEVNFIDYVGHSEKSDTSHIYSSDKGLKLLLRPEDKDAAVRGWYGEWGEKAIGTSTKSDVVNRLVDTGLADRPKTKGAINVGEYRQKAAGELSSKTSIPADRFDLDFDFATEDMVQFKVKSPALLVREFNVNVPEYYQVHR